VFSVGFTGIYYEARHDVGGGSPSVALFGDPGYQPTQLRVLDSTAISNEMLSQARRVSGIEVWPSTPLGAYTDPDDNDTVGGSGPGQRAVGTIVSWHQERWEWPGFRLS
jgi:hypothetical protein